mmetsp:Transcript_23208/g.54882  ORF Transcript_23208/g.54882 Transcript_23208/m.54882 type:complete len:478 (-) Transcript_23208:997-2430(-)
MGKRGNEHGQIRKEDLDAELEKSSSAPKGPFEKAPEDVLKRRRIVRGARKFGVKKTPASTGAASTGIFSGVSLKASPAATGASNPFGGFTFGSSANSKSTSSSALSTSPTTKPTSGGGKTLGGFSFGSSNASATATSPATTQKPAFPTFAMSTASQKSSVTTETSKTVKAANKTGKMTADEQQLVKCAQGFVEHIKVLSQFDKVGCQGFVSTFCALAKHVETVAERATVASVAKATAGATPASSNWDSSRPLFAKKPLISPTAGSASKTDFKPSTSLFGSTAVLPAAASTGLFSFNPTKTEAAAAPVPAFSFSTAQSPAVKAAAEKAAASATGTNDSKPENNNDNDADGGDNEDAAVLEAANSDYEVLYKTRSKVLHVRKSIYYKGLLKVEKHKETGKYRLVVRDETVGKVKMNTAITKGMPLEKAIVPASKKKKATPIVLIKAIFDETTKDEPEDFKIITSQQEHENLYNELKKLV